MADWKLFKEFMNLLPGGKRPMSPLDEERRRLALRNGWALADLAPSAAKALRAAPPLSPPPRRRG